MKTKTGKQITSSKTHHAGAIAGCVHLAAHDIGYARVGRKTVWFSWGSLLDDWQVREWHRYGIDTIKTGVNVGAVIPLGIMKRLQDAIVWDDKRDKRALERQIKATEDAKA